MVGLTEQRVCDPQPERCSVYKDFTGTDLRRHQQRDRHQVDGMNAATNGEVTQCAEQYQRVITAVEG